MWTVIIRKNGSAIQRGFTQNDYTAAVNCSVITQLNGSSDYIDIQAMQNSGGSLSTTGSAQAVNSPTFLMGFKIIGA